MLLVITGCIRVDSQTPYVTICDTEVRMSGYLNTVRWALEETDFSDIIFCDSSGIDLSQTDELKDILKNSNKRFECHTFQGNIKAVHEKGKGFGEGEILKYVYTHSKLMKEYNYFYKIIGRLTINNIKRILLNENPENVFIFDVGEATIDTRFYKVKIEDYQKTLLDVYTDTNDREGVFLEHVYYRELYAKRVPFRRFNRSIEFRGVSGTAGEAYDYRFKENWFFGLIYTGFLYKTYWGRQILKYIRRLVVR